MTRVIAEAIDRRASTIDCTISALRQAGEVALGAPGCGGQMPEVRRYFGPESTLSCSRLITQQQPEILHVVQAALLPPPGTSSVQNGGQSVTATSQATNTTCFPYGDRSQPALVYP